jgi:hypothetical protein
VRWAYTPAVAGREARAPAKTAETLGAEALDWRYRWLWMPMLGVQAVLYTRVLARFFLHPSYPAVPTHDYPLLHENHIGNLVSVKASPNVVLLGVHLVMAWAWIVGVLAQKQLARSMNAAVIDGDPARYAAVRRMHARLGMSLVVLGFIGIGIAPVIALLVHGNPPMKWFLVAQIVTFYPPMAMVLVTVRDRARPIAQHRFWAEFAFVGPAVASVWTEAAIYLTGRYTSLGPNAGEVWSSAGGGALGFLLVVVPAWFALRRSRA